MSNSLFGFDPVFLGWLAAVVVLAVFRSLTGRDKR
jgi:hypothetical protein